MFKITNICRCHFCIWLFSKKHNQKHLGVDNENGCLYLFLEISDLLYGILVLERCFLFIMQKRHADTRVVNFFQCQGYWVWQCNIQDNIFKIFNFLILHYDIDINNYHRMSKGKAHYHLLENFFHFLITNTQLKILCLLHSQTLNI